MAWVTSWRTEDFFGVKSIDESTIDSQTSSVEVAVMEFVLCIDKRFLSLSPSPPSLSGPRSVDLLSLVQSKLAM